MAVDLPGIRAAAELDLSLFRQQEAQFRAALGSIGAALQQLPNARVSLDTGTVARSAAAASQATTQMARDMEREARRATAALEREARATADAYIRESRRATTAQLRDADARLRAAERAAREEAALAQRAQRQERAADKRTTQAAGGVGLGLAAGGAAVVAQLKEMGDAAADFDKAMSQVRAVMAPAELAASGPALEKLARDLGDQGLGFRATQAAAGLEEMAKAGISATEQLAAAPSVLALAAAGAVTVAESAAFAANAMTVFGKSGKDIPGIVDLISGAAVATTADVRDLQQAFGQFGAVAKLSGQSVESTITAIALLAQAGIKGSDAGTSLRTAFLRLQPATVEAADAMRRFGIITAEGQNQFINANGTFKDAAQVAEVLKRQLGGLSEVQRQAALETIFGADAVRSMAVFTEQGAAGWAKLQAAMGETTAIGVASERLNNLRGDLQKADAAWNNLQISFGKQIEPNLRPLAQQFTELARAATQLSPEMQRTILIVLGGAAAFATITGTVLAGQAAFATAGVVLGALGIAVGTIAAPVAIAVAAVTALGVAWVQNWGDIQGKTQAAGDVIGPVLARVRDDLEALASLAGQLAGAIGSQLGEVAQALAPLASLGGDLGAQFGQKFIDAYVLAMKANPFTGPLIAAVQAADQALAGERDRLAAERIAKAQGAQEAAAGIAAQRAGERTTAAPAVQVPVEVVVPTDATKRAFDALAQAKGKLDEALKFAGQDREAIAALLELKKANDQASQSIDDLVDRSVAAEVVALRNAAASAQDATAKFDLLRQANELLAGHMAAQEESARRLGRTQGDATSQARQQAEAERQLGEAIKQVPLEGFNARARQLIDTVLPQLSQETANLIKVKLVEGETYQAVQLAAAAYGVSQAQVTTALHGSGAEAERVVAQIRRLAETAAPAANAQRAIAESARQALGTITQGLPVANRAWAEYRAAREGDAVVLAQLAQQVGIDPAQVRAALEGTAKEFADFQERLQRITATANPAAAANKAIEESAKQLLDQFAQGLPAADAAWLRFTAARQGDAATFHQVAQQMGLDAREIERALAGGVAGQEAAQRLMQQITARQTLAQTDRLLPAPGPPPDARRDFNEAARAADRQLRESRDQTAIQRQRSAEDIAHQSAGFAAQGREIEASFAQRQQDIQAQLGSALSQIGATRSQVLADFDRTALRESQDFNRQWARQQRDFVQQDAESLRSLREQAGDLLAGGGSPGLQAAAGRAVQSLLGATGAALRQGAAQAVELFSQQGDAAHDAAQAINDAITASAERLRAAIQQINAQAAATADQTRQALLQAAASETKDPILQANIALAQRASQQQSILTNAAKASQEISSRAEDEAKNIAAQVKAASQAAQQQRAAMIQQLTRMVEGFQRSAFQTVQGREDQRADTAIARARAEEDATRALGQQLTGLLRQVGAAQRQAAESARDNERQRDQQRLQLQQQEQDALRQQRRQREDEVRSDREVNRRHREAMDVARENLVAAQRMAGLLERFRAGVQQENNFNGFTLVETAVDFLETATDAVHRALAAGSVG